MSITVHDYIAWALAPDGGLIEAKPLRPTTHVRTIHMTEEVAKLLLGPWDSPDSEMTDDDWARRCGSIQGYFDRYLNGKRITVALDPRSDADNCFLKRLHPAEEETWEIRCREPPPGIRIFGRFAETNIFIALHWGLRKNFGGWGHHSWDAAISTCRRRWGTLFGSTLPKSGSLNDYIGKNAIPV